MNRKTGLIIGVTGMMLASAAAAAATKKTFSAADVESVRIENGSGDVSVKANAKDVVTVKADKVKGGDHCKTEISLEQKVLKVTVKRSGGFFSRGECEVNIDATIPEQAALAVRNGSGDVRLEGGAGDLEAKTGSGNIEGTSASSQLHLDTGSGDITLQGLKGTADVSVGSGNIELGWTKLEPSQKIAASAGSGNITLSLPKDVKVNADITTGSGRIENEFGSDRSGVAIRGKAGSGNVTIKKAAL